jgi:hypothetical protein
LASFPQGNSEALMNSNDLPKRGASKGKSKTRDRRSLLRISAYVGVAFGAVGLLIVVLALIFGRALLNGYAKQKAEQAFAKAHPEYALRIGELSYAAGANKLVAQSIALSSTNTSVTIGQVSLTDVRWVRLLVGTASLEDILVKSRLDVTNLHMEFPQASYQIHCTRLHASMPDSELRAEGIDLQTLAGDEPFFAERAFRRPRFHVVVPECRIFGLGYGDILNGRSYRAQSVHFSGPSIETLINRDKPRKPFVKSPPMLHEALALIRKPLEVGSLTITNAHVRYCERYAVGADPAVLTFGAASLSALGVANRGDASVAIQLQAQGDLMNAGTLKVVMSIPINSPDFSLRYSGSLGAMDLTRLDAFLDIAEHTRIKSGKVHQAAFEIDVTASHARGRVHAIYRDLEMAVLDKRTGDEEGIDNRVASFFLNVFKIRNANGISQSGVMKEGEVEYMRRSRDTFLGFVWFALRTGVLDVIQH